MKPSAPRIKERKASSFLENSKRIAWGGHFTTKKSDNSYGYAQKFTDNLYFSLFFSIYLCFSPKFSDFLRFSLNFSTYLGFSSYICSRNSAARKKGGGVIIFKKVLKNDAALPSAMDSRAFLKLRTSDSIAGDGGAKGVKAFFYLFTFLLLRDEPAEKDNEETSHHIFPLETWQGIYLILPNLLS